MRVQEARSPSRMAAASSSSTSSRSAVRSSCAPSCTSSVSSAVAVAEDGAADEGLGAGADRLEHQRHHHGEGDGLRHHQLSPRSTAGAATAHAYRMPMSRDEERSAAAARAPVCTPKAPYRKTPWMKVTGMAISAA